jgi:transcriptional regulator GlxA family with amidase domain
MLLQQLLALLPGDGTDAAHPTWLGPFEQAAALFLHSHHAASPGSGLAGAASREHPSVDADSAATARLERLEAYIRSRPFAPSSLADLARVAGVTTRTLNTLCHRYRGVSPMGLLRNLRLEGARGKLLSGPDASITDIALEHGFGHFGRFSAYYRERFGELPRQTSRQS